jgi:fumarate hydratase subunit beta
MSFGKACKSHTLANAANKNRRDDMIKAITIPEAIEQLEELRAGDMVQLSGTIITGRDAAHRRITDFLDRNIPLPFQLTGQGIYYTGPCPAGPGKIIGSCGPTTSSRMDSYTPRLLNLGLKFMIGKGQRSHEVIEAMIRNKAVYFAATGGAGALIAECVKKAELLAFEDLGPEAVYRLEVANLPLITAIDCLGNNLYKTGPKHYEYSAD